MDDESLAPFREATVGQQLPFYGVSGNDFKLGDTTWEAIEDESDGYRSYLDTIAKKDVADSGPFFREPLATVRVEQYSSDMDEGYRLVDVADGHVWLSVGTDSYDDYYPCFRFEYTPKKEEHSSGSSERVIR